MWQPCDYLILFFRQWCPCLIGYDCSYVLICYSVRLLRIVPFEDSNANDHIPWLTADGGQQRGLMFLGTVRVFRYHDVISCAGQSIVAQYPDIDVVVSTRLTVRHTNSGHPYRLCWFVDSVAKSQTNRREDDCCTYQVIRTFLKHRGCCNSISTPLLAVRKVQ